MKIENNLTEEATQASAVDGGKIDSFSINPKEMEKQRIKESKEDDIFKAREELITYLQRVIELGAIIQ